MPDYRVIPGPAHIHPFASAIASDDLIFITGVAAPGETAAEQTRGSFQAVEELLKDVGSSLSEVVFYRAVVTDRSFVQEVNQVMAEVIPEPRPACGVLSIGQLVEPSLMFEVEVIAQRGARLVLSS